MLLRQAVWEAMWFDCGWKVKVLRVILAELVTDRNVSLGMEDQPMPILVLDSIMCHRSKLMKAYPPFYRLRDISDWCEYSLDFSPLKPTTAGVWPTRIEVSTDGNTMPCISSTLHKYRICC